MKPRYEHSLRPVKSARAPSQIATIDARVSTAGVLSWYGIIERLEGGKWTRRQERAGTSGQEVWAWLWARCHKDRCTWLWAIGWPRVARMIDLQGLAEYGECGVSKASLTARVWWVQLWRDSKRCELVDAHNWWEQLPAGIWQDVSPGLSEMDAARLTCERLHRTVTDAISVAVAADLGVIQPTIGAWASNVWRHWHTSPRVRIHIDEHATRLERAAYYGGEVIARREGRWVQPYHGVDVNGLFPSAMARWRMPHRLVHVQPESTSRELLSLPFDHAAISVVDIDSPTVTYPVRHDGKMLCAVGRFTTVLPWPELSMACELGHVTRVGETAIYRTADLFSRWAQRLWQERLAAKGQGKKASATLTKGLAVALYGKLGMRAVEWQDCSEPCLEPWSYWLSHDDEQTTHYRAIGEKVQRRVYQSGVEPMDSFPAISAWTTSAARLAMQQLRAGLPDKSWVYQYIDTLVVDVDGLARLGDAGLMQSTRLGFLRHDWSCKTLEIRGPGWLLHDDRRRIAGVGQYATQPEPDIYELPCRESPAGYLRGRAPHSNMPCTRTIHYERPERVGRLTEGGWVDPPLLNLL